MDKPLLMIPGPIEISPAVEQAVSGPPPGHLAPGFIAAFGRALGMMRTVWQAPADAQPYVVAGSGTTAMDMAIGNLLDEGDRALVPHIGYFSDRIAEMARRRGATVDVVPSALGEGPDLDAVAQKLRGTPYKALLCTHVDTSTGTRNDAAALAALAREHGALSVFDGVCSIGGEQFDMAGWGADVVLTGSQKAIGLPPGLGLLVVGARAQQARDKLQRPPALVLDYSSWRPIMTAYEAGTPSYFATPATTLVRGLDVALAEVARDGMDARFALHKNAADAFRAGFAALGLSLVTTPALAAHTISAVRLPGTVDAARFLQGVSARGVVIAGGLHPALKGNSFRVGHMGHVLHRPDDLRRTMRAIGESLRDEGHDADVEAALAPFEALA